MVEFRDSPDRRKIEIAGVWERATIATLLLGAAAIMTAYTLNLEDIHPDVIVGVVPSDLAIVADPAPPATLDSVRDAAAATMPLQAPRRDGGATSAIR